MVAAPPISRIPAPNPTAVFSLIQAIALRAAFVAARVEAAAAEPWAADTTEVTNAAGAACTEFAEIPAAIIAAGNATPRLSSKPRSFSNPRETRFRAASSLIPKAVPTWARLLFSSPLPA